MLVQIIREHLQKKFNPYLTHQRSMKPGTFHQHILLRNAPFHRKQSNIYFRWIIPEQLRSLKAPLATSILRSVRFAHKLVPFLATDRSSSSCFRSPNPSLTKLGIRQTICNVARLLPLTRVPQGDLLSFPRLSLGARKKNALKGIRKTYTKWNPPSSVRLAHLTQRKLECTASICFLFSYVFPCNFSVLRVLFQLWICNKEASRKQTSGKHHDVVVVALQKNKTNLKILLAAEQ